jgi:DNA-binding response OmpR family regulator
VNLQIDDLILDPNSISAYACGRRLALTAKEFSILEYLMSNAGRVVSQEELLEHVWNEEANIFTQTIKVHINNLRNKLDAAGKPEFISTVKGKGYVVGAK